MPLVVGGAGRLRSLIFCVLFFAATLPAPAQLDQQTKQLSRDIFQQLIEINTTDSVGSTTVAANAMAQRLLDAGFPKEDVVVLGPNDRKGNLVARLHGTGAAKPILLIGHLDVVEALRSDWTTDPFQFVEKDGYFFGRGTQDMKESDAVLVTTFIRFKKSGFQTGSRPHPGTHRRRGGRQVEWRRLAAQEPPRPGRRGLRAQLRFRRCGHESWQACLV